jgi:ribonucleoside-triphosphate reductase
MVEKIRKRDGRIVNFEKEKIIEAIWKAAKSVGGEDRSKAEKLGETVIRDIDHRFESRIPNVEEVQDIVEKILIEEGHAKTAKAYILYRKSHQDLRDVRAIFDTIEVVENYVGEKDWAVKENSNMSFSLQGLNNYIAEKIVKNYWLRRIYPEAIRIAHENVDIHVHDLGTLGPYCVGWDLKDLLMVGFGGVGKKVQCAPPKRLRTALGQAVNFMYTLQHEAAGAQAFSNFDTLLAPFIYYDNLTYKEVKQCLQEFLFNMNVPTRVGCQCLSEDTKILTPNGWKMHNEVKMGETIYTFNISKKRIEKKKIRHIFAKKYSGVMYNLINRSQNQLISPNHRVVRQVFNTDKFVLEPIEEVLKLSSPIAIPVLADNLNKDIKLSDKQIKLIAWVISEGSIEKNGSYRVSIYQKKGKNYKEIKYLLDSFNFEYSERETKSLGTCNVIRLKPSSSKVIHKWLGGKIKKIPSDFYNLSKRQARIFLETYINGDGWREKYRNRITTTDENFLDFLKAISVLAGFNFNVKTVKPRGISKKLRYVLTLTEVKTDYIQKIRKIDYSGIIWSVNTENETVIAERKGQVFITGNTPFTNITIDLKIPNYMKNEPVIIGGRLMDKTYGEFQEQANTFNQAFAEVMMEGDAKGRVFTFPIPTYNITKDFDWDNPEYDIIWEMTSKYGIPYFSNFINSDMNPEDARSMCCRLRLDQTELRKRGGGLFGANPLTGSIGVVTINLARLGFTSANEKEFFEKLEELMDLAKESLEIKRKAIENFTIQGLYPYSKYYLRNVHKRFGQYWKNHFATIGLLGMNEGITNFMENEDISTERGKDFALRVLDFMREKLEEYQKETGNIYNLEATPGEGTTYRFARADKKRFPKIKVANEKNIALGAKPYYTNSTHLPVNFTDDLFKALELQDPLQTKYTGGTVFHGFIGEKLDKQAVKLLVKKIAESFKLPYFTITPTFSICPVHGYLAGEHEYCPKCEPISDIQEKQIETIN